MKLLKEIGVEPFSHLLPYFSDWSFSASVFDLRFKAFFLNKMKTCRKCSVELNEENTASGRANVCKPCYNANRRYLRANKIEGADWRKDYFDKRRLLERTKRERDIALAIIYKKAYKKECEIKKCNTCDTVLNDENTYKGVSCRCKSCHNAAVTERRNNNPDYKDYKRNYNKKYKEENRDILNEKLREYMKTYKLLNKEKLYNCKKIYRSKPENRILHNVRKRLNDFLSNNKSISIERAGVGCSREHLVRHIESQFKKGMSWDNYGTVWHIDHIIPISKFKRTKEELIKANHFTNLQPLSAEDNIQKSNRIDNPIQPELCMSY